MSLNDLTIQGFTTEEVVRRLLERDLEGVNPGLADNPKFKPMLEEAVSFLMDQGLAPGYLPPVKVYVSDDGKNIKLRGGVRKSPSEGAPELQENLGCRSIEFFLEENDNMRVVSSTGTQYRKEDYSKFLDPQKDRKFLTVLSDPNMKSVLSVYHQNRLFTKDGIEIQRSHYEDITPTSITYGDEETLKYQTNEHKPDVWTFNLPVHNDRYAYNPKTSNAFRYPNDLGVVQVYERKTKDEGAKYSKHPVLMEHPENLSWSTVPFVEVIDGEEKINSTYQRTFPEYDSYTLQKIINEHFIRGIEKSATKTYHPSIYEALKKMALEGYIEHYNSNPFENMQEENSINQDGKSL